MSLSPAQACCLLLTHEAAPTPATLGPDVVALVMRTLSPWLCERSHRSKLSRSWCGYPCCSSCTGWMFYCFRESVTVWSSVENWNPMVEGRGT